MKSIALGFALILVLCFARTVTAQKSGNISTASFQTNRSVGIASTGINPARLFSLQALSLLVPLTDNTEMHLAASCNTENLGDGMGMFMAGDDFVIFPRENVSMEFRAAVFYHTPEVSGFTTRLGVMGYMVFVVPGTPGVGETVSRMSFGSGEQKVGPACGFTWSFHRRVRLAAYYWPCYYRVVKPEEAEQGYSYFTRPYEKRSGISTSVILELAIKPF